MANTKELIEQMYGSSLESAKQQLQQDYDSNISALDQQKAENEKATQVKLNRTAVEADKAKKNYLEVQNAYGLSSGAMAQARLAQDNQLQADMATIRAAQQTADQGIESQRTLLAQQFQSAISKAQADNDLEKAKALYELAREEDDRLRENQKIAASAMASVGDYSLYGQLYGLTPAQIKLLESGGKTSSSSGSRYSGSPYTNPTPKPVDDSDDTNSKSDIATTKQSYPNGVVPPHVWESLIKKGHSESDLVDAGLITKPTAANARG